MSRSSAASMFVEDEPILRFEESSPSTARPRRAHSPVEDSLPADDASSSYLKRKQEELLKLRQQLERTERETSELEVQRRKEERFASGRREVGEKLSRSLVRLDRELYNAHKAIEEITAARDLYQRHLEVLRGLQPESWQQGNLDGELDRAIAAIDDAEVEYGKTARRLAAVLPDAATLDTSSQGALPSGFTGWLTAGFAFTLPAVIALMGIAWLVLKFAR